MTKPMIGGDALPGTENLGLDPATVLNKARNCMNLEIEAIQSTAAALDESFTRTIQVLHDVILAKGKLIFTGVGKNTHIVQKLVGTFNSTGVPACFLDPNQARHGDLGLCSEGDLVFLFSNSGETEEILRLLPLLHRLEVRTVAVTAHPDSELAKNTDLALAYHYEKEACPLALAPTASTTAALALGDALAMVYLDLRGFEREAFARLHPGGNLGKSLLFRVDAIMRSGERFACLPHDATVREAILAITRAKGGTIALTDPDTGLLTGVFSDGDFRRCALREKDFLRAPVMNFMTGNPKTVRRDALAGEVLNIFEKSKINDLIVVGQKGEPVGIVDGQDLPKLKIV